MRIVYTLTLLLLLPVMLLRTLWPGRTRRRGYATRWRERLGFFVAPAECAGCIWFHAVSLGEVNTAAPLVRQTLERHPERTVVVTTGSPSGSAQVTRLFGESVFHVYLPVDLPGATRRFLRRLQPALGVVIETELWPNLYHACRRRRVPLMIANARLSARSLRARVPLLRGLLAATLACVTRVAAQSRRDAACYRLLGMNGARIAVLGNLKFDLAVPADLGARGARLRQALGGDRPVWLAASTHAGEEVMVLAAAHHILAQLPEALLVLVPRHPERAAEVISLAAEQGLEVALRSRDRQPAATATCLVVDTMGELLSLYAAADVAFVGGSLVPIGGHNALEAAAAGCPAVTGPHTGNFVQISATLVRAGALRRVASQNELAGAVLDILSHADTRAHMRRAGLGVLARERGATARTLACMEQLLPAPPTD